MSKDELVLEKINNINDKNLNVINFYNIFRLILLVQEHT